MIEVIQCLSEPRRLEILTLLRDQEMAAGEIADHFAGTRQATSHHLKLLERAELVSVRSIGTRRIYRANREGLRPLREFLENFWAGKLARLKQTVEANDAPTPRSSDARH